MKIYFPNWNSLLLIFFTWFAWISFSFPLAAQVQVVDKVIEDNIVTENGEIKIVQIVEGLEHPWAISWLPDGKMLVTERGGFLYLIEGSTVVDLKGLPKTDTEEDGLSAPDGGNQGGLLDVVVHPEFSDNGWVYLTYSSPGDDDSVTGDADYGTGTALARAKISQDNTSLTALETIYAQVPRTNPGRHYGSRILLPGDGTVLFSIGDRGLRWNAQDLVDPAGSILRLKEAGGAAEDNPFVGVAPGNLRPEIYSFGHRNNQGMAMDPNTEKIWATEHGPNGGDLVHLIEKGNNYGWPQVSFGTEYETDEKIGIGKKAPGVSYPKYIWEGNMAPSGLAFYHQGPMKAWNGNLFAGSLNMEQLHRLVIQEDEIQHEEILIQNKIGRIRDVRQGPDGHIYVVTDEEEGGIYRIEAVDQ